MIWTLGNFIANFIYDYQNLIAGIFAVIAAFLGARALLRATTAQLNAAERHHRERDRRKLYSGCRRMAADFMRLAGLARQAEGTITVTIAENATVNDSTRKKTKLILPEALEDQEFMSLLPTELLDETYSTIAQIHQHNFDMDRAGGAFGDDNFQAQVKRRAKELQPALHRLSNLYMREANQARALVI